MPARSTAEPVPQFRLDAAGRMVFIGLLLGMFVSSIAQTIVGPAIPRVIAELGGMEHYSWLATTGMLVTAVSVPIIGKLSDLYGRRTFYLLGLGLFMLGSALSGAAPTFWFLVFARGIQGLGMGALMPLSQTIVGDIIPPRFRGKYQGIMGAIFGFSSIVGPLAGGWITDNFGWRWLFYISLPFGLVAFWFIWRYFHLDQERREARIDWAGISTLTVALVAVLLATSLGGTTFPWASPQIIGMYVLGAVALVVFVFIERRAPEPVVPLRLFRSSVFGFANLANLATSMLMFGVLIYVPVFAQGGMGLTAGQSGAVLVPMSVAMILTSILVGLYITHTGRYKPVTLLGVALMVVGLWLLTRLHVTGGSLPLVVATMVFGVGMGACMQNFTLIVQNVVMRRDLGTATATTQFFRSAGGTVGIAIFGTVLSSRMGPAIAAHLPAGAGDAAENIDAGSVLDPAALAALPAPVVEAVRLGVGDAMHAVFFVGFPIAAVAFVAAALIKNIPLRTSNHTGSDSGRDMLDSLSQSSEGGAPAPRLGLNPAVRTHERVLGIKTLLLSMQSHDPSKGYLQQAVARIGDGDIEYGRAVLETAASMLLSEDP